MGSEGRATAGETLQGLVRLAVSRETQKQGREPRQDSRLTVGRSFLPSRAESSKGAQWGQGPGAGIVAGMGLILGLALILVFVNDPSSALLPRSQLATPAHRKPSHVATAEAGSGQAGADIINPSGAPPSLPQSEPGPAPAPPEGENSSRDIAIAGAADVALPAAEPGSGSGEAGEGGPSPLRRVGESPALQEGGGGGPVRAGKDEVGSVPEGNGTLGIPVPEEVPEDSTRGGEKEGGSKAPEVPAKDKFGGFLEASPEDLAAGPDASRPSRCPRGCSGRGTCNEERGVCFCRAPFGGGDCSAHALPACQLAPGYFTPCFLLTTCECLVQCHRLRLPVHHLCFRGTNADGTPITDLNQIFSGPRYKTKWNEDYSEMLPPTYDEEPIEKESSPVTSPENCPQMCSGHGVCDRNRNHCQCPWATSGMACESFDTWLFPVPCYNGCSGRGECVFGECVCQAGFFGIDCSLFIDSGGRTRILARPPYSWTNAVPPLVASPSLRPRVYVYDLPLYFNSWQALFSPGLDWTEPVLFLERLLNSPHRTPHPEEADYFYLPLIIRNRVNEMENIVSFAIDYVRQHHPFFNRSQGADHFVLTNNDWGNCQLDGPSGRGFLPRALSGLITLSLWALGTNMEFEEDRPCFRKGWDVAIPPVMDGRVYQLAPNFPHPFQGEGPPPREILLYFQGSSYSEDNGDTRKGGLFRRSFGARQELFRHFEGKFDDTGVLVETFQQAASGPGYLQQMVRSRFCYAPAGFGWAMRTTQAVILGCIPVVVQPNVTQAFQGDGLNWDDFAVFLRLEDIPRMDEILRSIPKEEVARKQAACFHVRDRFVWSSTNSNPFAFLPLNALESGAAQLVSSDAFIGVMEALKMKLSSRLKP